MLTEDDLGRLLEPYLQSAQSVPSDLLPKLVAYLDLLLRWNARMNLTAVRSPTEIVQRHFGESLFAGAHLSSRLASGSTLLDIGSGAGFPGLPVQLLLPNLKVTLAESQGKKAAFLREAIRTLELGTEVWSGRAEDLPADRTFDAVALRAVDRMTLARAEAERRVAPNGWLVLLAGADLEAEGSLRFRVPCQEQSFLYLRRVQQTPSGA